MERFWSIVFGVVSCATIAACSSVRVYDGERQLRGIPFYAKRAVDVQTTERLVQSDPRVKVRLRIVGGTNPGVREPFGAIGLAIDAAAVPEVRKAFEPLMRDKEPGLSQVKSALDAIVAQYGLSDGPSRSSDRVLRNTLETRYEVNPQTLYYQPRAPLMGKSDFSLKLAADQTLTEASGSLEDTTAQTVLSLFPITATLSRNWGLVATASATPAISSIERVGAIEIEIVAENFVYTLEKRLGESTGSRIILQPLAVADALEGRDGVRLLAVRLADDPPPSKPKPQYGISGAITLPDAN